MPGAVNPFYAARRRPTSRRDILRRRAPTRAEPDHGDATSAHWTGGPCWYVVADTGERRVWLAGPFWTEHEAVAASPRAALWAVLRSGDENAGTYSYRVHRRSDGWQPSVLGPSPP